MKMVDDDDEEPALPELTPYQELRKLEQMGPVQYAWLLRLVQRVARANGFPPPAGAIWDDDGARQWLSEQFSGTKGPEFFARVGLTATDDLSYSRLASKSIKNALIDQARGTVTGLMRQRLRGLLAKESDFVDVTSSYGGTAAWTLNGLDEIWTGDFENLLGAPGLFAIGKIQKLNRAGKTPAHIIEKLVAAARILIRFAGGALSDQVLATLIVRIFDLDELAPYGLRDTDADPATESELLKVEESVDLMLGWHSEVEYFAPAEWLAVLAEAKELLKGLVWQERLALVLAEQENIGRVVLVPGTIVSDTFIEASIEKFRRRVRALGTSREAQKVALAHCLKEHAAS